MASYDIDNVDVSALEPDDIIECDYSGTAKEIVLPKGTYKLECWGAQGGQGRYDYLSADPGKGGYSIGTVTLNSAQTIYVYAGGSGSPGLSRTTGNPVSGGFNGGGDSGRNGTSNNNNGGGSGGGGSDIRIGSDSLYARIIVAGGGGGGGNSWSNSAATGGAGGGTSGINGTSGGTSGAQPNSNSWGSPGGGGSQTSGGLAGTYSSSANGNVGSFGVGGNGNSSDTTHSAGGGGGGGWYGGGAGAQGSSAGSGAGGGGSGYVYTSSTSSNYPSGCLLDSDYYLENAQTMAGNTSFLSPSGGTETGHSGNGYVKITVIEIQQEEPVDYNVYNVDDYAVIISEPVYDFAYTGAVQTATLQPGRYKLECWGAQGGTYSSYSGGLGGYSVGTVEISNPTNIYVYTGGTTSNIYGGFNGGGNGNTNYSSYNNGGGGGSDIRIGTDSLYSRVIVAGGGGGAMYGSGGYGGGLHGGAGSNQGEIQTGSNRSGGGGSQTYAGITWSIGWSASFGQGGNHQGSGYENGGGGGGWYGGAAGYDNDSDNDGHGGGGGSGYVYTSSTASNYPSGCLLNSSYYLSDAQTIAGNTSFPSPSGGTETGHSGNGYVRITQLDYVPPSVEPVSFNPTDRIKCQYNGSARALYLASGKYKLECYGAQGGGGMSTGGKGGYATGVLTLTEDTYLYIYVGGRGVPTSNTSTNAAGGFNGGGDARTSSTSYNCGSGGGASDIRVGTDSLLSRVIVAGGGGGSGGYNSSMNGGIGGGQQGEDGYEYSTSYYRGRGATQSNAGISWYGTTSNSTTYFTLADFGHGGSAKPSSYEYRSGGGGGFYGGGGSNRSGAGGGSGYVYTSSSASKYPSGCTLNSDYYLADAMLESGKRNGDGYILITVVDTNYLNMDDIEFNSSGGTVQNFAYTGNAQTVTLQPGQYKFECWGAEGGNGNYYDSDKLPGKGGYSIGYLTINSTINVYVLVGGQGSAVVNSESSSIGGFNGGGSSNTGTTNWSTGSGGGGSDIRIGTNSLYARVIVAGGGGGSTSRNDQLYGGYGGAGGGTSGLAGGYVNSSYGPGGAGTQTSAGAKGSGNVSGNGGEGSFGQGGNYAEKAAGGGGGGWYGGGAGYVAGGGGGSGYVYTSSTSSSYPSGCLLNSTYYLTDAQTIDGNTSFTSPSGTSETGHSGNGHVRITKLGEEEPTEDIPKLKLKTGDIIYCYQVDRNRLAYLPKGIYQIECYGAQGGYGNYTKGGLGGYSKGLLFLQQKQNPLYFNVGGMGKTTTSTSTDYTGGYNGGGSAYTTSSSYCGGSGGGGTDVRIGTNSLNSRVIVAGGGGGGSGQQSSNYSGGSGGGTSGSAGTQYSSSYLAGTGGTQNSAGTSYYGTSSSSSYQNQPSFGQGGGHKSGTSTGYHCGGGGGWYGGGGSGSGSGYLSGAGGGSGYVYTEDTASYYPDCQLNSTYYLTEASTTGGQHYGDGYIRITVIDARSINARIKIDNVWKEVDAICIRIDNSWKEAENLLGKIADYWKESS